MADAQPVATAARPPSRSVATRSGSLAARSCIGGYSISKSPWPIVLPTCVIEWHDVLPIKGVAVGDPNSKDTEMGPLVSKSHFDSVASYVPDDAPVPGPARLRADA